MPGDRLVYLGNFLGRGPQKCARPSTSCWLSAAGCSRGRCSFAYDVAYLRGGQEEMWQKLLQLQFAPNPREVLGWMLSQGVGATLAAYGGDPRRAKSRCPRRGARASPAGPAGCAAPCRPSPAISSSWRRCAAPPIPTIIACSSSGRPRSRAPALRAERQLLVGRDRLLAGSTSPMAISSGSSAAMTAARAAPPAALQRHHRRRLRLWRTAGGGLLSQLRRCR